MAFTPLNALNAYLAVARRRSFAAAARELGVSPSALSQSVRQLEKRLGVALLTRTSRNVAMTDAGRRLLDHAGPAVDQALESLSTVSLKAGEISGRIRLSVPTAAVSIVLGGLLPRFVERHPKIEVEIRVQDLRRRLAVAGVGLIYTLEPMIADDLSTGKLRVVLEPYAPVVPGLYLYFPSRAQVSPSLRAFVEVARELRAAPPTGSVRKKAPYALKRSR